MLNFDTQTENQMMGRATRSQLIFARCMFDAGISNQWITDVIELAAS